jgi:hypothetical protein
LFAAVGYLLRQVLLGQFALDVPNPMSANLKFGWQHGKKFSYLPVEQWGAILKAVLGSQ